MDITHLLPEIFDIIFTFLKIDNINYVISFAHINKKCYKTFSKYAISNSVEKKT